MLPYCGELPLALTADHPPAVLTVFKNKASFGRRNSVEERLKSSRLLERLGETEEEALYVVVPKSLNASADESQLSPLLEQGRAGNCEKGDDRI